MPIPTRIGLAYRCGAAPVRVTIPPITSNGPTSKTRHRHHGRSSGPWPLHILVVRFDQVQLVPVRVRKERELDRAIVPDPSAELHTPQLESVDDLLNRARNAQADLHATVDASLSVRV